MIITKENLQAHGRVTARGCWLWRSMKSNDPSYGVATAKQTGSKPMMAHRLAWTLFHGPIPDGMLVCHRCDVRPCFNPEHLFLGTAQDNTDDMIAKGRHFNGRGPKSTYEPRTTRLHVTMPSDEHDLIRRAAEKMRMPVAAWLRREMLLEIDRLVKAGELSR